MSYVQKGDPRIDFRTWTLVWVVNVYDWHPKMLEIDHPAIKGWCNENCHDLWTEHWFQDNMAYCFKDINDAVMFSMVCC